MSSVFPFYISVSFIDNVEIDQVMKENPQIIENKGLVPSFLFSSALFGLILKELHDSKAVTAFLFLFQTLKSMKGFLILVPYFSRL